MSIVQLNIRTRIELETRVLAAALKQSFERGDSDGVSLAHRQLFLLLKDQKAGNGISTAEAAPAQTNGDTVSHETDVPESHEVIYDYDSSATDRPDSALDDADSEDSRYQEQAYEDQSSEEQGAFQHADAGEEGQPEYEQPEYEAVEGEQTDFGQPDYQQPEFEPTEGELTENEQPEFAPTESQQIEYAQAADGEAYDEQTESGQTEYAQPAYDQTESDLTGYAQPAYDQVESSDQSGYAQPAYDQTESDQTESDQTEDGKFSDEQTEFERTEYTRAGEEGDQQTISTEAEDEDDTEVTQAGDKLAPSRESSVRQPAGGFGRQTPEQAHAIAQYLKYKQTREQFVETVDESDKSHGSQSTSEFGTREASLEPAARSFQEEPARPLTEEEEFIRMRKPEPPKKVELPFDHQSSEYAEIFGSSIIETSQAQNSVPTADVPHIPPQFPNTAERQVGPFDAIPEPPSFGQFENRSSTFTSSADLPPELRQPPPQAFPKISPVLQSPAQELPKVRQNTTQDLPQVTEFPDADLAEDNTGSAQETSENVQTSALDLTQDSIQESPQAPREAEQDSPKSLQNATQDLPQIGANQMLDDIRNQQAAEYAERKASQSIPRKMPAIDFSLQSEIKAESQEPAPQAETKPNLPDIDFSLQSKPQPGKPDIDFSLEAEKQPKKPDIDFSLEAEKQPKKPDIDFSLQSETQPSKPDIDFSLQSETKPNKPDIDFTLQAKAGKPDIDFSLEAEKQPAADSTIKAPARGGFIEAEFVSSDTEPDTEHKQDITSELPVINPAASLYLDAQDAPTPATMQPAPPSSDQGQVTDLASNQGPTSVPVQEPTKTVASTPAVKPAATPAPNAIPATEAPAAVEITGQEVPLAPAAPKPPDLYAMLGVSQMSPFEEIHKNFLRKIRKILLKLKTAVRPERDELLKELRRNWVARDILCDPVTRTDYDFRDMGLRGSPDAPAPHAEEPQRIGQRTPLRIGELLQCAGLLEQAELEIACDMHKAMPEVQFGTFLVRQGFIQERDLDSVLLGQTLLRDGKITVAQFQVAMELSQSRGANISDTLIDHGYITAAELSQLTEKSAESGDASLPDTPQIKEVPVKPRPAEPPAQNLNTSSAVPTWKDQLDWSKPLPVDDDASLIDRNPEKQSLAELLGNVNSEPAGEPEGLKISNNAAPSWKDQLDWHQPQETENDTTDGAEKTPDQTSGEKQDALTEEKPPLSIANAVPSWKDQLDWEQPKEETTSSEKQAAHQQSQHHDELEEEEEEEEEEEPMIHGSKETQPISIYPPNSVAPNITLGKGNSNTASDTESKQSGAETKPDQTHAPHSDQATTGELEVHDDQSQDDEHDGGDDEHAGNENEGFFKRNLNKLKKGDSKDKKKKRK
ncbi:MAG: hypothetical protein JST44_03670 [Cyanobacteria bacterium SZAS LIN-5]|nr:hypothetical protein [Cyanobacteria bacterium SZAS LIN-5]